MRQMALDMNGFCRWIINSARRNHLMLWIKEKVCSGILSSFTGEWEDKIYCTINIRLYL